MNEPISEISVMLGGHPQVLLVCDDAVGDPKLDVVLHALPPETLAPAKNCAIPLPVRPEHQHLVDESFRSMGRGSIDARFGTNFNQQEK